MLLVFVLLVELFLITFPWLIVWLVEILLSLIVFISFISLLFLFKILVIFFCLIRSFSRPFCYIIIIAWSFGYNLFKSELSDLIQRNRLLVSNQFFFIIGNVFGQFNLQNRNIVNSNNIFQTFFFGDPDLFWLIILNREDRVKPRYSLFNHLAYTQSSPDCIAGSLQNYILMFFF